MWAAITSVFGLQAALSPPHVIDPHSHEPVRVQESLALWVGHGKKRVTVLSYLYELCSEVK